MPRTEKQYEEIREERKKQIMNVALELIAKEGFTNVTIAKIASKADISKGLMYNYFKNKEELIYEIMLEGFKVFGDAFDPNKDGILTDDEMKYFFAESYRILKSNTKFWRIYFMVMFQPEVFKIFEPKIAEIIGPFMKTTYDYFKRQGSTDPNTDMRLFGAILDGIALNYAMAPKQFPLEGVLKRLHEIYK
jgi:AcrR family transcriptional regulator